MLDLGRTAKEERNQKIIEDIEKFAEKLSETEFNDAIVYTGNFQNLEQLERDTKATDFHVCSCYYLSYVWGSS